MLRYGRGFHSRLLTIRVTSGSGKTRVGFIVGTKVSKRATQRNIIKRRLRAIAAESQSSIAQGKEVAIIARPPVLGEPYHSIKRDLIALLEKARLLP